MNVTKNLDQQKKVVGIYFDLQKVFNTVDYGILLHTLYSYGIRGVVYKWLEELSYWWEAIYCSK